jgi:hypothetical protein
MAQAAALQIHEREVRPRHFNRLQLGDGRGVEHLAVGPVRGADAVEGGAAGHEAALLGVVRAPDEAHVLAHAVSVVIRWSESVFCHHPARGKNDEVDSSDAGLERGAGEDCEYGGVEVVEGHGVHHAEQGKVVLVRRVVAVPADNVERAVILPARPQRAPELVHDDVRRLHLLERGVRHHEVARAGEPIGADGPEVRQFEVASECFANVS